MQTGGMLLLFKAQEIAIQCRMAEVLESASTGFGVLTLSSDDYAKSIIDKNELMVDGKVYDIKSIRVKGNSVTAVVMEDKEEEGVLKNIFKIVNNGSSKNLPDELFELLTISYILPDTHIIFLFWESSLKLFATEAQKLLHHAPGIVSPPPELA
jgi:hypothetical protein